MEDLIRWIRKNPMANDYEIPTPKTNKHAISRQQLEDVLNTHPLISQKHKKYISTRLARVYIAFTTIPIVLRPSSNLYENIDGGGIPYIDVGPQVIILDIFSGSVRRYTPSRNAKTRNAFVPNSTHPHQQNKSSFCFGGFGTAIGQAIMDGDIALTLDCLSAFLHHANDEDAAGSTWKRWVPESVFSPVFTEFGTIETTHLKTLPDGQQELWVERTELLNETLPHLAGSPVRFDFWNGTQPLHTGHLALHDGSIRYVTVLDGKIFTSPEHPATYTGFSQLEHLPETEYLSKVPLTEQIKFAHGRQLVIVGDVYLPIYWNAVLSGRIPKTLNYVSPLRRGISLLNFRGGIQLAGPLSIVVDHMGSHSEDNYFSLSTRMVATADLDLTIPHPSPQYIHLQNYNLAFCTDPQKPRKAGQIDRNSLLYLSDAFCVSLRNHSIWETTRLTPIEITYPPLLITGFLMRLGVEASIPHTTFIEMERYIPKHVEIEPWLKQAIADAYEIQRSIETPQT